MMDEVPPFMETSTCPFFLLFGILSEVVSCTETQLRQRVHRIVGCQDRDK